MSLDHARDFFSPEELNPESLAPGTLGLFVARWVTHVCAPCFVGLAGLSVAMQAQRKSWGEIRKDLIIRGLLLMALEATWVSYSWLFHWNAVHLGVLWAIGGSMLLLAIFGGWGERAMRWLGGGLAVGIWLLWCLPKPEDPGVLGRLVWPGQSYLGGFLLMVPYAVVPWFGVMALGFGWRERLLGPSRGLVGAGLGLLGAFLVVRGLESPIMGAPYLEAEGVMQVAGFFNPSKYPPLLSFQLWNLGLGMLLLAGLRWAGGPFGRFLGVLGSASLFFYLLHLPLFHLAAWVWSQSVYGSARPPAGTPLSWSMMVGSWLAVPFLLWIPCQWWAGMKRKYPGTVLRYL